MKLIACHIDNFGKLSDLTLSFDQGLNVFHHENAWGKSTLAAFLRVMFYGFESKRESGSFDKERNVFRPWQGGVYGGEVDFEYEGKIYRVSRTFGKTEKTDEFHLYDLSTNLECHDFSTQIGSELFGLDSGSFKRTAFIAQSDCECGSTDAINAKLGNLAENTNDINNFEAAVARISDRLNKLSPTRATGSMKKRTNAMTLLEEEIKSFDAAETAAKNLSLKIADKQKQRKEMMDIRDQYAKALKLASEESRREGLKQTYEELQQELMLREHALEEFEHMFPERVPEDAEFQKQNQDVQMLGVLKTTLYNLGLSEVEEREHERLAEIFAEGCPDEEELAAVEEKIDRHSAAAAERAQLETKMSYFEAMAMQRDEQIEPPVVKRGRLIVGIVGIVIGIMLLAAGLLLPAIRSVQIPVVVLGAILPVCGIGAILSNIAKRSAEEKRYRQAMLRRDEELQKLQQPVDEMAGLLRDADEKLESLREEILGFLALYQIECEIGQARTKLYELRNQVADYERLSARLAKSNAAAEECERTRQSLLDFGKAEGIDFGEDIAASLSQMHTKATRYRLAKKAYDEVLEKKHRFEEENDMVALAKTPKCPYRLDELNDMIREVDEKIEEVREALEQYHHQMEDLQEQLDLRDEKEQMLAASVAEQKQELHDYEVLESTKAFLQSAKEQFSARYLGPIEQGFEKYYEMLTGDASGDWMVNANIEVRVKEQGELRETKWLSAGYRDLLGICMRFALVDAMYPNEKPFLVLDDPYVNLDEEKVQRGYELLEQISEEYQVIYFTCNDSRVGEEK